MQQAGDEHDMVLPVIEIVGSDANTVGGLLYKTYFSGSKNVRNKINVNPFFWPQKGTFSDFLSVFHHYDRPNFHYDRSDR